jgi:hypothetical protein
MRFRALALSFLFLLGTACASVAPTPILINTLTNLNDEALALYVDCSEGANYVPAKEGCDPTLLSTKVDETRDTALHFISADIKQPHGYDIYLEISLVYFRIYINRNLNEYTRAEQIARQFFETQKAHSGSSIDTARYWWAWYASATASKQFFEDPLSLTSERKADLLLALGEGTSLINKLEGPRLVRLHQALDNLQYVIDLIQ